MADVSDKLAGIKSLLGTKPDHELASQAGVPVALVARYRRKLGIPASAGRGDAAPADGSPKRRGWKRRGRPARDLTAVKAAGKKGAPKARGRKKGGESKERGSKLDAHKDIIGKIPDKQVAERAGVSTEGVRMYRKRHGILLEPGAQMKRGRKPKSATAAAAGGAPAPAVPPRRGPGRPRKVVTGGAPRRRISKLDPFRDLLGTMPDRELAEKAGVTAENVRAYRRRHNIDATWRGGDDPAGPKPSRARPSTAARRPARAARPSTSLQGYAIHVVVGTATHEYMVIAADISSAAESAVASIRSRHPSGEITAIRHLGPALA